MGRLSRPAVTLLATFALCVASWPVSTVRSAVGIEILREDLVLSVSPATGITVCAGEKSTVTAALETETTYRLASDPASTLRTMTRPASLAGVVRAVSDDPAVGDITPQFQAAIPPGGAATFTFEGKQPGRTNLRLSETQNAGYRAQTIGVAVDDCTYLVSVRSNWVMADGFQPDMLSISVGTLLTRTSTPGEFKGTGTSHNIAIGIPQGGCIPTFNVSDGTILMTGTVDSGTLTLELAYRPIVANTIVDCIIVGGTTNVATPDTITVRVPADSDSTVTKWGHILNARGGIPGKTEIDVQHIRIPS